MKGCARMATTARDELYGIRPINLPDELTQEMYPSIETGTRTLNPEPVCGSE